MPRELATASCIAAVDGQPGIVARSVPTTLSTVCVVWAASGAQMDVCLTTPSVQVKLPRGTLLRSQTATHVSPSDMVVLQVVPVELPPASAVLPRQARPGEVVVAVVVDVLLPVVVVAVLVIVAVVFVAVVVA